MAALRLDLVRGLPVLRRTAKTELIEDRVSGISAGACSALWLAFQPDLADTPSGAPVACES